MKSIKEYYEGKGYKKGKEKNGTSQLEMKH